MGNLAPMKPCPRPHCGKLSRGPLCAKHLRERDQQRESAAARGYDAEWAEYSRGWLARFPWCGQRRDGQLHMEHSRCVQSAQRTRAQVTDHIVPLRDGGARLDPANHQSLCYACNQWKVRATDRPVVNGEGRRKSL